MITKDEAIKEVSDVFDTIEGLYSHRNILFVALMLTHPDISWKAKRHSDRSKYDGWFVAGMNLPSGVITYHVPDSEWDKLNITAYEVSPDWDGHTPDDVQLRVREWIDLHLVNTPRG